VPCHATLPFMHSRLLYSPPPTKVYCRPMKMAFARVEKDVDHYNNNSNSSNNNSNNSTCVQGLDQKKRKARDWFAWRLRKLSTKSFSTPPPPFPPPLVFSCSWWQTYGGRENGEGIKHIEREGGWVECESRSLRPLLLSQDSSGFESTSFFCA